MIYNLGSLNIDRVFRVPHIVRPGETLAAGTPETFAGGKGANQSVALTRAGAQVAHIGRIGPDGTWLLEKLAAEGIDVRSIHTDPEPTGQAIIQVDPAGQNAILIQSGANACITPDDVEEALAAAPRGSWLLTQNETCAVSEAIRIAKTGGLRIAFNPAPFDPRVLDYPLELVDLLCVNETEAAALAGEPSTGPDSSVEALAAKLPSCEILLTLGSAGAIRRTPDGQIHQPAARVEAVDTTAAGDTFLGYYLAGVEAGADARDCLEQACRAAAACVTRTGAMDSIPHRGELPDGG